MLSAKHIKNLFTIYLLVHHEEHWNRMFFLVINETSYDDNLNFWRV